MHFDDVRIRVAQKPREYKQEIFVERTNFEKALLLKHLIARGDIVNR